MGRRAPVEAREEWRGGEDRGVAAAPGDDRVGLRRERLDDRLDAHLPDQSDGAVDLLVGEVGSEPAGPHLASIQRSMEKIRVDLGGDDREFQGKLPLPRDVLDVGKRRREMRITPGRARGPDHGADACSPAPDQQHREIGSSRRRARCERPGTEVVRPRVGRAHVGADGIGLRIDACPEGIGGHSVAELAGRAQTAHQAISRSRRGTCCCAP